LRKHGIIMTGHGMFAHNRSLTSNTVSCHGAQHFMINLQKTHAFVYHIHMRQEEIDEALGISRCARCGHRLDNEVECPFCSLFPDHEKRRSVPKWVFLTTCFFTAPLSIFVLLKTSRLNIIEKAVAFSGVLFWTGIFLYFF